MISRFEYFVSRRYLQSKRKEVFVSVIAVISVLAVAVSVMVLNIVLSIMTGFEAELKAKLLDQNAHIVVRRYGGELEDWENVQAEIKKLPEVTAIYPYTYSQAMLAADTGASGLLIKGLPNNHTARDKLQKSLSSPDDFAKLFVPAEVEIRRPDGLEDRVKLPPLIIGKALRNRLNLTPGTVVNLFSPQLSSSPQGLIPRAKRFVVVGIYSSGLQEYESGLAYASMEDAQKFFNFGPSVTGLEISVKELMQAPAIAQKISQLINRQGSLYYATDWTQPNKALWDAIELEQQAYFYVLLLLILIASFTIVSTLVMVVMEKSKDIAILKTIGATDMMVLRIFLLQGTMIGVFGTVLGTLLGYLGAIGLREYGFKIDQTVFALSEVPVTLVGSNFLMVAISAFIITSLAGVYPAVRAARLKPADALRFE